MILKRISHPRVIIDVLTDVRVEEIIKILVVLFTIGVRANVVIDTLSCVSLVDATIDVVYDNGVEVLTDANTSSVLAAITDLYFAMTAPGEGTVTFS